MAASAAERMRRHRDRQRAGRISVSVEIDDVETIESLVSAGFLAEHQRDDRGAIARAIEALLHVAAKSSDA